MSLIFDALQRSEAERSGIGLSSLSAATEVLQLAELRAASDRKAALESKRSGATQSAERDTSLPVSAVAPVPTAVETPSTADPPLTDNHLDAFGQFQSLQVVVIPEKRLVALTDSDGLAAEKFRFLGVSLQHLRGNRPLKKVLITSTIPQEGKSMVAANLACALARRTQQRTLLVEGDVRRPSLLQIFGLGKVPGICECLQGERTLKESVYYLEGAGLWLVPAGSTPKNPLELLQSGRLSAMMDPLTAWFDWIIIDSPPIMPLADTSLWMSLADGILLVVRQGTTEKKQLQRGLDALQSKKLIGTVLNGSKRRARNEYYYASPSP